MSFGLQAACTGPVITVEGGEGERKGWCGRERKCIRKELKMRRREMNDWLGKKGEAGGGGGEGVSGGAGEKDLRKGDDGWESFEKLLV